MKIDRVLGVLLSILVVIIILLYNNSKETIENQSSFGLLSDSGAISDNSIVYDTQQFDEDTTKNEEVMEFYNKENYPVTINSNEISINCDGSTKEENEMVKKNYIVKATFSNKLNGKRENTLTVLPKEKVYIYVNSSYTGMEYPVQEVTCKYSFDITASV